jgi:two-component system copper resistance phosphate regulon response regulator CusR
MQHLLLKKREISSMNEPRILIVEDELKVASFIKQGLEESHFEAHLATDGKQGKKRALKENFNAIILDIQLPEINGYDLCRQIRAKKPHLPILMLTALGTMEDKLKGFDSGADDYLVKPFEFRELLARLRALLKRSETTDKISTVIRIADLELDTVSKTVKRGGKEISLTAKEFMLLEFFMHNQGRIISRSEIAERIWDINFETGTNVIDVYINFLRKKIEVGFSSKLIHTHIGMGYMFKETEQ